MSKMVMAIASLGVVAGLGVASMPLSTYAAVSSESKSVSISVEVDNTIGLALSSDTVDFGKVAKGGVLNDNQRITATVSTSEDVYNLNIKAGPEGTDLKSGSYVIPASDLSTSASGWGVKGGDQTDWFAVQTTDTALRTGAAKTDNETVIDFGVKVADDQQAGTYTGSVTITATAGN